MSDFYYTFPALKGRQAGRDYFVIMCPLNVLSKLFIFNDEEMPAEYRAQRVINKSRIPEIAEYIVTNPGEYVFSSLTASIDGDFNFIPYNQQEYQNIGMLNVSMDSKLLINDGQHRRAAIEEALKASSSLINESISVVLFIDENLKRSQQIFADLNKHAVNVSKSIGILYDSRDPISMITKRVIDTNQFLSNYTDKESTTLPKFSPKLFILSSIYETNKKLLYKLNYNDKECLQFVDDFWDCLCRTMNDWQFVFKKEISPHNFRNTYISSNGVVLEALGLLGNYLYRNEQESWKDYVSQLSNIDWNRTNLTDWGNRVISPNGRIVKSSSYIKLTYNKIKQKLSLPLSAEEQELETQFYDKG